MRLTLCSSAAPDATLSGLFEACARRGLDAVELRDGDGHGVDRYADGVGPTIGVESANAGSLEIATYRASSRDRDDRLASLARAIGATLLLDGDRDVRFRIQRAGRISKDGTSVAIVVRGARALEDAELAARADIDVAWDAEPAAGAVNETADRLLERLEGRLRHIRLLGGGPEASLHEGRGIGEAMGRLALHGYTGTVALAPSSSRYRLAWQRWLGRRGGWGCGSRTSEPSLVHLLAVARS